MVAIIRARLAYIVRMSKQFKLKPEQIQTLVFGLGSCLASDRITVDGERVGYMYREKSDGRDESGWSFFSGDESQEYCEVPGNFSICNVNTIVNYDREIALYLNKPFGTAWARNEKGEFEEVPFSGEA
jgi:hypothetical protein